MSYFSSTFVPLSVELLGGFRPETPQQLHTQRMVLVWGHGWGGLGDCGYRCFDDLAGDAFAEDDVAVGAGDGRR